MESLLSDRLLAVLIILMIFLYIGWSYRTNSTSKFHTADRKVKKTPTVASLFTVVGAPHFAIFTSLAYLLGWLAVGFYLGAFLGLFFLAFRAKKIREYIQFDAHSFNDIAAEEIGKLPAIILSSIGIIYVIGVVVAQLILGAHLLSTFSDLSYSICIILMTSTVVGYLIWGGYGALVNTDVVQGIIMLLFTLILALYMILEVSYGKVIDFSTTLNTLENTIPLTPLLFLAGILAVTGSPEMWQRILNAESDETARKSSIQAGSAMLVWGILVVTIGIGITQLIPTANPDNAFVSFITTKLPIGVLGLVSILIISAILSTADTEIFMATILFRKELTRRFSVKKELDVFRSRLVIIAFGLITIISTLLLDNLMTVWGILLNIVYISAPLALSVIFQKGGKTKKSRRIVFTISALISIIIFVCVAIFVKNFFSWWALLVIVSASIPFFVPSKSLKPINQSQ